MKRTKAVKEIVKYIDRYVRHNDKMIDLQRHRGWAENNAGRKTENHIILMMRRWIVSAPTSYSRRKKLTTKKG